MKAARILIFFPLLFNCCRLVFARDEKSWTIDELVKGLRARDQVLKSFSFDARYQIRMQSESTGKFFDYATADHVEVDRSTGRYFVQRYGQVHQPPAPMLGKKDDWTLTVDEKLAFDGERTRHFTKGAGVALESGKENGEVMRGTVYQGPYYAWVVDPGAFLGVYGKPLADLLADGGYRTLPTNDPGMAQVEGERVINQGKSDEYETRSRYLIDCSKNMAVAEVEWFIKYSAREGWIPYYRTKTEEWVEIEGFWMPRRFREVFHNVKRGSTRLVTDTAVAISNWSVNHKIPDERFKIAFLPGTIVNDTDRGTTYRAGKITDRSIAADARAAAAIRDQFDKARDSLGEQVWPGERWHSWSPIAVGLIIFFSVGVGAATLAYSYKRAVRRLRGEKGRGHRLG